MCRCLTIILFLSMLAFGSASYAQQSEPLPAMCGTSQLMEEYYQTHPDAQLQREQLEQFTQDFISGRTAGKTTATTYTIPVVFHVYDSVQGGFKVNDTLIKTAIEWLNKDFHGLNADYGTVHSQFMPLRDTLDITFALARKDPNGNPTTGILYYPVKAGYAQSTSSILSQVAADAWDNYKYLNIYVMVDLYGDGNFNRSGVGTYPSVSLFNDNVSRIVYNGKYLAYNNVSIPEFASVLTHECGHYLNLIHTFEGGCMAPNDEVNDTPPCTNAQGCHVSTTTNSPLNCNSDLVNSENYMDYNYNCYKMFTKGQVARMTAALNTAPLNSLWKPSNLTATGVVGVDEVATGPDVFNLYPNPTTGEIFFSINSKESQQADIAVTDPTGRIVYSVNQMLNSGMNYIQVDISTATAGLYLLKVATNEGKKSFKVTLR